MRDMTATETTPTAGWVPDDSTFGARLALVRHHMGWNLAEAARACGQNDETWAGWEKHGRAPRKLHSVAREIAEASGCSYMWLMLGGDSAAHPTGLPLRFALVGDALESIWQLNLFGEYDLPAGIATAIATVNEPDNPEHPGLALTG